MDDCVVCGRAAGYHRAVVDVLQDRVVGGLCRECEREEFGRVLERGRFGEECVFCDRDGHVALPIWRPDPHEREDGTVLNGVTYRVDRGTVHLCDEHVSAIAGEFPTERAPTATANGP